MMAYERGDGQVAEVLRIRAEEKQRQNTQIQIFQHFLINIENYIYLVPFVENDTEIFLKMIIPSRKATREYLKDKKYGSEN